MQRHVSAYIRFHKIDSCSEKYSNIMNVRKQIRNNLAVTKYQLVLCVDVKDIVVNKRIWTRRMKKKKLLSGKNWLLPLSICQWSCTWHKTMTNKTVSDICLEVCLRRTKLYRTRKFMSGSPIPKDPGKIKKTIINNNIPWKYANTSNFEFHNGAKDKTQ